MEKFKNFLPVLSNRFVLLKSRFLIYFSKQKGRLVLLGKKLFSFDSFSEFFGKWWHRIIVVLLLVTVLYFPIGGAMVHNIDDDINYQGEKVEKGQSYTVSMISSLIRRETELKTWTPNLPFFFPSSYLDNMPNYQLGMVNALSKFAIELSDQLGRMRGSSQADTDLENAAGMLKYPGTRWIFDPSTSFMPTASANKMYKSARKSLINYNKRLANGEAVFEARADNLISTLDKIAKDLGSSSAIIDKQIITGQEQVFDFKGDDVFYSSKGKLYAYYLILRELGKDYDQVIKDKELGNVWGKMITSFEMAASLEPAVVINGSPDGQFLPSHLSSMGFYLLRARTKLQEVSNILLK
jgi:hypothetical protein